MLRLLRAEDALVPSSGDGRIDITIATTAGADHYVFSEDMRHRLLFSRTWHRPGISGVFYGLNPILSDMEGPLDKVPARSSLRNIVGVLQSRGSVRCVSVLNLFTLRTSKARDLDMTIGRFAGSADEDAVLAAADIVIPAWGGGVKAQHMAAVYELLRHLVELGRPPMLRAKGGHILTTTMSPAQPLHARLGGYQGVTLVPAPQAWIEGGALVPSSSAVTMHPISQAAVSPPGVGARGKGDRTEVEIGGSPAESHLVGDTDLPPDMSDLLGEEDAPLTVAHGDLVELCRHRLDPVSARAAELYLAGRFDPRHQAPDMPPADLVASRARRRGGREGAIDLAVVALRVVGHMSWWRIGEVYGLSTSSTKGALGGAARTRFLDAVGRRDRTPKPPAREATRLAPENVESLTLGDLGRAIGRAAG